MITEGGNLALRILSAMEIEPAALSWAETDEPGGGAGPAIQHPGRERPGDAGRRGDRARATTTWAASTC